MRLTDEFNGPSTRDKAPQSGDWFPIKLASGIGRPSQYPIIMTDVTQLLEAAAAGDSKAAAELLPLVYDELRRLAAHKLAGERPDHTLQPTALVHEAYL